MESGGDSSAHSDQSASVVRTVLHGPDYEWKCETRRPVLVSIKLFWQQWTGLARRPTTLTHLVCLSGVPWDENDNGHLMAGASARARNSDAPGEQMEQTLLVRLSPDPEAVEEDGVTPGPTPRAHILLLPLHPPAGTAPPPRAAAARRRRPARLCSFQYVSAAPADQAHASLIATCR